MPENIEQNQQTENTETANQNTLSSLATKNEENTQTSTEENIKTESTDMEKKTIIPEGVSVELWDAEKNVFNTEKTKEEIARLTKIATDFRKKISKGVNPPKKAEEYSFSPVEDIKTLELEKNEKTKEIIDEIKKVALEQGLSQPQFDGFLNGYFKMLIDKKMVEKPLTTEEIEAKNEEFKKTELAKLGDNPEKTISNAVQFIDSKYKSGILNEEEKKALIGFIDAGAINILAIDKIRQSTGEEFIPVTGTKVEGVPSDAEIAQNWKTYTDEQKRDLMEKRIKAGRSERIDASLFRK